MFEYHQNTMCISASALYEDLSVISLYQYRHFVNRDKVKVMRRGCRNTPALVMYESLPVPVKEQIEQKAGNPYKICKPQSKLEKLIEIDGAAVDFYRKYTLEDGTALPEETQRQYVAEASILNACKKLHQNIFLQKRVLSNTKGSIWDTITELVHDLPKHTYPHKLPTNPRSFRGDKKGTNRSFRRYIKMSYEGLIHKNFLNKNSEKVNELAKQWLLSRWSDQVEKCPSIQHLFVEYNKMAIQEDWKPLKEETTIRNYLYNEEIMPLWYGFRYGELKAKQKYNYLHSTSMPTMRDSLWYSDGTKLNYFYQDDGKTKTCQVYEVMDAFSEVLLGYHISPTEDFEAQYSAYKMALQTAGYKPYQVGFDGQGGHNKLKNGQFLTKIARMAIKTQPYNGPSKTIELAFKRFQEQFLKQDWFFTGQNIEAKKEESKVNREFVLANIHKLPTFQEIKAIYAQRRMEWNQAPHHATGKPRLEMYLESANPKTYKINMWDMVDMFWVLRPQAVTCTAYGIQFTEKGVKHNYMVHTEDNLPDITWLRRNIDKKFRVKFDPEDFSLIYLYEETPLGLRFVKEATPKIVIARGKQEQDEWEAEYIKQVQAKNNQARIEDRDTMYEIMQAHGHTAEQRGLNTPHLKGIESKKRKSKAKDNEVAMSQKKLSNAAPILNDNEDYNIADML